MADLSPDWFIAWHAPGPDARLDDHIRARVPALSKERVKEAFAAGRIRMKGAEAPGSKVAQGARIECLISEDEVAAFQDSTRSGDGYFPLYVDDDIILVDKSAGVLTVPTDEGEIAQKAGSSGEQTLVDRIVVGMNVSSKSVMTVHRLDRFTSGVLVLARNKAAKASLITQFARHTIVRRYLALTQGIPEPRAGTFRSRLESDARHKQHISQRGEIAITHYEVAAELKDAALVWVVLETGRRNQIRVHFAEAGWPLLGEHRYGREKDLTLSRQALHAAELAFVHPRTNKPIAAASPLPGEMRRVLERLSR